jgi:hypothetical protein
MTEVEKVEKQIGDCEEVIKHLEEDGKDAAVEFDSLGAERAGYRDAARAGDLKAKKRMEDLSWARFLKKEAVDDFDKLLDQERQALAELFRKLQEAETADLKSERALLAEKAVNLAPTIQEYFAALAPVVSEFFSLGREIATINEDLKESTNVNVRLREALAVALVIAIPELRIRVVDSDPGADTPESQRLLAVPLVNIAPQIVNATPATLNESLPAILGRFLEHQQLEAAPEEALTT